MKNKRILQVLALPFISLFVLSSCNEGENSSLTYVENHEIYGSNATYDIFNNKKITVGMWVTPPDNYRSDEYFKLIAESGINMVNGFAYSENTEEEVKTVLEYCDKYNLNYLFASLEIENDIRKYNQDKNKEHIDHTMSLIDKFASYKSFAGALFVDEPNSSLFDAIGDFFTVFKEKYPNKLAYVNMLPPYALAGTGYSRYEDYVDGWFNKTNSTIFSYDHYPLIDANPTQEGYSYEYQDYYYSLDILRNKTLNKGVPLWTFAATLGYEHQSEYSRREPSREDLRWTVFSNLAFGAKAIQYFCFFTPSQDSFNDAMITRGGVKTKRYDYVKEVNNEFKNYEEILVNADAIGVMMNDYRRNGYYLYDEPLQSFGPIRSVDGNKYLIGCFTDKDNGNKTVMITATTPRDDIDITLNMYNNITEVEAYIQGVKQTLKVTDGKLKLKINKGDSVVISFK